MWRYWCGDIGGKSDVAGSFFFNVSLSVFLFDVSLKGFYYF